MSQAYVNQSIENNIGYITFFTPEHNAMPSPILKQLELAIKDAGKNNDIKVIVLKSGGERTFCAGASFTELVAITNLEEGKRFFSGFANVINAMRKCPKLIIGRVQGKAVGGGVGLASATDYCLATKFAAIKLSEISIGIGPFVIEPAVTRKMGQTAFSQMTIDAETFFTAEYAKEKGLYANVFDTVEALDNAVDTLAAKLASYNPEALLELKRVLWEDTNEWCVSLLERAEISGKLVLSDFTKEKLKSYK
ncbi:MULTISPECIES: enoyl-CoA hydratase/isomerase family protein [Olleya]|jgi:methylglutaconyl-CoA hydratase|uniref:Enoyl-CoA hydratase/isomerase family protein n=1 Tax=Olleya marilimosa TaxID=272164 RepID=A0ABR8LW17_9FLAO|nr:MULTISPECIES: enoyl-CoA hydratase/isomerase family protein [Olleya]MBD3864373.1 enoyl-CoA hydratase/isomerase family protein [Olleya marilimosa]MBD3891724.1 enoyl-CoA hydratase/isomerase family protein [Olleya marilimosa]TVZ47398.1 methylglutaconyl-CoA hydratase [Olleya sp. Hel_I_94]